MKHLLLGTFAAASLLTACQPASGGVNQADFDALKTDVNALNIEVFGDPKAKCPADKIIDLAAYGETGAPEAMEDFSAWHAQNGERSDVKTTESGLQYTVIQSGDADGPSPVDGQVVTVNYHGTFTDGSVFDSSYQRGQPAEFPSNRVIAGWIEALGTMKPCDAWTVYIPGDLAYGPAGRSGIPPNATLIFNVQLLEVNK